MPQFNQSPGDVPLCKLSLHHSAGQWTLETFPANVLVRLECLHDVWPGVGQVRPPAATSEGRWPNLAHLECLHDGPEPIADAALAPEILLAVAAVPEHGPLDALDAAPTATPTTPSALDTTAHIPCSRGPFPAAHRLRVLLCILLNPWWAGFPGDSCNLEERLLSKGHHSLHIVKHNLQDE